jgi:hypothetical protein
MTKLQKAMSIWVVMTALVILTVGAVALAQFAEWVSSDVLVRNFTAGGTNRVASEITTIIGKISNRQCRMIFDGGPWTINQSIGFPTNVSVGVAQGSYFDVALGSKITFSNNSFEAGPYIVFAGNGTATGTASFLYRWVEWGALDRFNIGSGVLGQAVSTTQNFFMVSGTTGTFQWVVSGTETVFRVIGTTGDVNNANIGTATVGRVDAVSLIAGTLKANAGTATLQRAYADDIYGKTLTISNSATMYGDTFFNIAPFGYGANTQFMARLTGNVWYGGTLFSPEYTRTVTGVNNHAVMANMPAYLGKWIPYGQVLTIQYPAGTHYSGGNYSGFFGGGTLRILGDTSQSLFTNQSVIITNLPSDINGGAFMLYNNSVRIFVQGFHFITQGTNRCALDIVDCPMTVQVKDCYFESDTTNLIASPSTASDRLNYGVVCQRSAIDVQQSYSKSNTYVISADYSSSVMGWSNYVTGAGAAADKALVGVLVDHGSRFTCFGSNQFQGVKYDGYAINGGTITTAAIVNVSTW